MWNVGRMVVCADGAVGVRQDRRLEELANVDRDLAQGSDADDAGAGGSSVDVEEESREMLSIGGTDQAAEEGCRRLGLLTDPRGTWRCDPAPA